MGTPARRRQLRRRTWRARLRRAPLLWWGVIATCAVAITLAMTVSIRQANALAREFGPLRRVPVLTVTVEAGDPIPPQGVQLLRWPSRLLPEGAVALDAAGRTALTRLVPGEVLLADRLAPTGLRGAAALLPPGTRALAIPNGPGGRPPVRVGDHVDVLATSASDDPLAEATGIVARYALVVALDRDADNVTVAVLEEEAPLVATALATATVTLALTAA